MARTAANHLTVIRTYEELRAALKRRKNDLGLANLEIDDIAGLQSGYTAKLLCGMKRPGDMSLPALLGALKCELVLMQTDACKRAEDGEFTIASANNLKKVLSRRAAKGARARMRNLSSEDRRKIARKGGKAYGANVSREKKKEIALKAANARWKKHFEKAGQHARTVAEPVSA